jgi:hypothetical protein
MKAAFERPSQLAIPGDGMPPPRVTQQLVEPVPGQEPGRVRARPGPSRTPSLFGPRRPSLRASEARLRLCLARWEITAARSVWADHVGSVSSPRTASGAGRRRPRGSRGRRRRPQPAGRGSRRRESSTDAGASPRPPRGHRRTRALARPIEGDSTGRARPATARPASGPVSLDRRIA